MRTISAEEFKRMYGKVGVSQLKPIVPKKEGSISQAFRGGIERIKQGIQQGKTTQSPLGMLESGIKVGEGAVGAAFSPLAPIFKPLEKGIEKSVEEISDYPAVQKFAGTRAGQITARAAEDIGGLATIAQGVAGFKVGGKLPKATGELTGRAVEQAKPDVAAIGRTLKAGGEGAYGVTITPQEGTARALQTYKEKTPDLATRIRNTISGETKGKPTTEANTAARYGLIGTEQEIGVQAGRYMEKIWKENVQPALHGAKGKLEMNKFWSALEKKIRVENPELTRRNALLSGLEDLKSGYGKVSSVGLEKLQTYKEGWTKFQSEQVWKGKPIASATKEVMKMAGDTARDFIYKNTPEGTKQAYIDYGNLRSIREAGIKSGVGDPAKKSISRGAWQFVMDKAVTPIATTIGKILYRTGEGLEFVGEPGAKTVGDIVGKQSPPNLPRGGIPKTMTAKTTIQKDLEPLAQEARKYKSAEELISKSDLTTKEMPRFIFRGEEGENVMAQMFVMGKHFTNNLEVAKQFAGNVRTVGGGILPEKYVSAFELSSKAKIANLDKIRQFAALKRQIADKDSITSILAEKGYDGAIGTLSGADKEIILINPNVAKELKIPYSQLTDFYNQAVKKNPIAP